MKNKSKEVSQDWTLEEYTEWHNKFAKDYPYYDNWYANGPHWHRTLFFLHQLNIYSKPNPSILDCGCSNGGLLKFLTDPKGYTKAPTSKIVGFDIAEFFVENAQKHAPDAICFTAPIENLPLSSGSFDFVIAGEILEHVLDLGVALKEAVRVLKPGGFLLTSTPSDPDSVGGTHLRYCDDKMLKSHLPGINVTYDKRSWLGCYKKP